MTLLYGNTFTLQTSSHTSSLRRPSHLLGNPSTFPFPSDISGRSFCWCARNTVTCALSLAPLDVVSSWGLKGAALIGLVYTVTFGRGYFSSETHCAVTSYFFDEAVVYLFIFLPGVVSAAMATSSNHNLKLKCSWGWFSSKNILLSLNPQIKWNHDMQRRILLHLVLQHSSSSWRLLFLLEKGKNIYFLLLQRLVLVSFFVPLNICLCLSCCLFFCYSYWWKDVLTDLPP